MYMSVCVSFSFPLVTKSDFLSNHQPDYRLQLNHQEMPKAPLFRNSYIPK